MKDLLTVDPDAEGEGAPFTVSCIYSDSYIDRPVSKFALQSVVSQFSSCFSCCTKSNENSGKEMVMLLFKF